MKRHRANVHDVITEQIISSIEAGAGDWTMPWRTTNGALHRPYNIATSNRYRGVNIIALWVAAQLKDYSTGLWGTYRQWQAADCQVRKGEKSTTIVFYKQIEPRKDPDKTSDEEEQIRMIARSTSVFNVAQVDGYTPPHEHDVENRVDPIVAAEQFVEATRATISHLGDRAYFDPISDSIHMPSKHLFTGSDTSNPTQAYWATMLHELTHWTAPATRCDRQFATRFGKDAYAVEELVALS